MSARKINQAGLDLIKYYEGLKLETYKDVVGVATIGYGHTGHDVFDNQKITTLQAEMLLKHDLEEFEKIVDAFVKPQINDNQFSALVSFVYNLGSTAFAGSTLLKVINKSWFDKAPAEFLKWVNAGGKPYSGLLARRRAEADLFMKKVT